MSILEKHNLLYIVNLIIKLFKILIYRYIKSIKVFISFVILSLYIFSYLFHKNTLNTFSFFFQDLFISYHNSQLTVHKI